MRPNHNSGLVSNWGVNRPPVTISAGGQISHTQVYAKNGLPGVSLIWGTTGNTLTQNFQYLFPFIVFEDTITVDAYLTRCNAGSATAVLKAYIYKSDNNKISAGSTATFVTGTDATIDVTGTSSVTTLLSSAVTLSPGVHFLVAHCTAANSPAMWAVTADNNWFNGAGSNPQDGTGAGGSRAGYVFGNTATAPGSSITITYSGAANSTSVVLRWT